MKTQSPKEDQDLCMKYLLEHYVPRQNQWKQVSYKKSAGRPYDEYLLFNEICSKYLLLLSYNDFFKRWN